MDRSVRKFPHSVLLLPRLAVKLGGYRHDGSTSKAEALDRAKALRSTFEELADLSHRAAARALNERGIKSAEGKQWSAVQVMRIRRRLGL